MSRFNSEYLVVAQEIIARYPRPKSALIPLLHLSQEQNGYVTEDAMTHIAELTGTTPAQVLGTCSFYEMFKREPVGRYQINICTNISCQLNGGEELLHHAEETLGIKSGGVTEDGLFSIEDVECIAACTEAPCMQVNYRYEYRLGNDDFDRIVEALRSGERDDIPDHGTLATIRQHLEPERTAGIEPPEVAGIPDWFEKRQPEPADGGR